MHICPGRSLKMRIQGPPQMSASEPQRSSILLGHPLRNCGRPADADARCWRLFALAALRRGLDWRDTLRDIPLENAQRV